MTKRFIKGCIIAVLLIVFLVSSVMVIKGILENRQGEEIYKEAEVIMGLADPKPAGDEEPEDTEENKEEADLPGPEDLAKLQQVNDDVFGWILIPGTSVSYPLLDGSNNSYYLTYTWDKQWNQMGSIFLEEKCKADFSDFNTIIYGHNMRNGTMFSDLKKFKKQNFWETAPYVYIIGDEGTVRYDIFAAFEADVKGHVFWLYVDEADRREDFIKRSIEQSLIDTDIVPTSEDSILTLSTCTGNGYAKRMVVQAVRAGQED